MPEESGFGWSDVMPTSPTKNDWTCVPNKSRESDACEMLQNIFADYEKCVEIKNQSSDACFCKYISRIILICMYAARKVPPLSINSFRVELSVVYVEGQKRTHISNWTRSAVFSALNGCKMRETKQPFSIRIIIWVDWTNEINHFLGISPLFDRIEFNETIFSVPQRSTMHMHILELHCNALFSPAGIWCAPCTQN